MFSTFLGGGESDVESGRLVIKGFLMFSLLSDFINFLLYIVLG